MPAARNSLKASAFAFTLLVLPSITLAHAGHKPLHGGMLDFYQETSVELVVKPSGI